MADLKPMDIGEILDGALTIFRRHFMLFMKIGIITLWFPVALTIYLELAGGAEQHIVLALIVNVIRYFAGLFLTASAIRIIADSYLGRRPELSDALAMGSSKIMPLFLVGFVKVLLLGLIAGVIAVVAAVAVPRMATGGGAGLLAVLLGILAGCWFIVYVACGYAVTTPVVVLEELNASFDAFGRSWDLTRGFKLKIFLIFLVAMVVVFVPGIAIGGLGAALTPDARILGQAIEIASAALPILLTPLFSCVLTLVYYDLRVRREAFDLEVLSEQLGAGGAVR
ncbi:MAG TPA: hypothetical protein VKD28_09740 [Gemmatimonadales bacterium]|nr:hypothetical protein [Gemmatimonadales bacterium]